MLIRISNINMEIDIFGAEDIHISKLCVGCMSFGKAGTRIPRMAAGSSAVPINGFSVSGIPLGLIGSVF